MYFPAKSVADKRDSLRHLRHDNRHVMIIHHHYSLVRFGAVIKSQSCTLVEIVSAHHIAKGAILLNIRLHIQFMAATMISQTSELITLTKVLTFVPRFLTLAPPQHTTLPLIASLMMAVQKLATRILCCGTLITIPTALRGVRLMVWD